MNTNVQQILGEYFKLIRTILDYKQSDLSEILGVSRPTIIAVEKGRQPIPTVLARSFLLLLMEELHKSNQADLIKALPGFECVTEYMNKVRVS